MNLFASHMLIHFYSVFLVSLVPHVQNSDDSIYVKSANGRVNKAPLSTPVHVFSPRAGVRSHDTQIVFFPDVPVNLLGRYLLANLQIAVVPVRDGLWAQRCADLVLVLEDDTPPHY